MSLMKPMGNLVLVWGLIFQFHVLPWAANADNGLPVLSCTLESRLERDLHFTCNHVPLIRGQQVILDIQSEGRFTARVGANITKPDGSIARRFVDMQQVAVSSQSQATPGSAASRPGLGSGHNADEGPRTGRSQPSQIAGDGTRGLIRPGMSIIVGATGSAAAAGLSTALYRGLIMNADEARFAREARARIDRQLERIQRNEAATAQQVAAAHQHFLEHAQAIWAGAVAPIDIDAARGVRPYTFLTQDPAIRDRLAENRDVLNSIVTFRPVRREAVRMGLALNEQADVSYSSGDPETGAAMLSYAEAFADIAIGLDPFTGPIRDTYEAYTGKNFVTQQPLTSWERSFAVAGAVSFGFGSKIGKGLSAMSRVAAHVGGPGLAIATQWVSRAKASVEGFRFDREVRSAFETVERYARENGGSNFLVEILEKEPERLQHYAALVNRQKNKEISIVSNSGRPFDVGRQAMTREALDVVHHLETSGNREVFRRGTTIEGRSRILAHGHNPQYWLVDRDLMVAPPAEFIRRVGGTHPPQDLNFLERARLVEDANYITRPAARGGYTIPGGGWVSTPGGGVIEVVVERGHVQPVEFIVNQGP